MAYFTAVLARSGLTWKARDLEVDDLSSLDELVDALRLVAVDEQPVLAVVEHEDEWFALVRVDGEDDPRLFVSDFPAAQASHYAELLAPTADREGEIDSLDLDVVSGPRVDGETPTTGLDDVPADGSASPALPVVWAGEPDLLEDLGVTGRTMRRLVEDYADDPGAALAEVAENVGFSELLEVLR